MKANILMVFSLMGLFTVLVYMYGIEHGREMENKRIEALEKIYIEDKDSKAAKIAQAALKDGE